MIRSAFRLCAFACLASAGGVVASAQRPAVAATERPRLVVLLVIDQFRADYAATYGHQWTKGLRRLFDAGAVFPLAAYPYAGTVTCAGHATISTGTVPATHGMIGNAWFDRAERRSMPCTDDPAVTSVPFGGRAGQERHGIRHLSALTLADELRLQATRPPRILAMSLKARSTITLAGRPSPATMAIWEEDDGTFATSSIYTKSAWPEADAYAAAHPVAAAFGQTWDRLLPVSAYLFADDAPGEPAMHVFPHKLVGRATTPDNAFVTAWERSPWSDAHLGDMAATLAAQLKLGQQPGTDMLAVSFSSLDLVGHAFGPRSHEVQDTLARLDVTLGALLDALDRTVGPNRYVLAMSSDHGVSLMPEQVAAMGLSGGRIIAADVRARLESAVAAIVGPGTHVIGASGGQYYLAPQTLASLRERPAAMSRIGDALREVPGVGRVYWADDLAGSGETADPMLRAARLSYFPGRSGDVLVMPAPYWIQQATGATHGSAHGYDQAVPVLFYGAGIKPGRYLGAASPVDIAPTLAFLAGITLSRTDGRVLVEALRPPQ